MTEDEAKKVATVLAEADGGCIECARTAALAMEKLLPEFNWPRLVAEADGYWTEEALRPEASSGSHPGYTAL